MLLIVLAVAYFSLINTPGNTKNNPLTGADPHPFEDASDLYNYPQKEKQTNARYLALLGNFNSFVKKGAYPEEEDFRTVLLKLDGAADLNAVNTRIEDSHQGYKNKFAALSMVIKSDVEVLVNQANVAFEAEKYVEAAAKYIQVLKKAPGHLDARNNLGLCDLHLGNNISAIMHFNLILAASPSYYGAEQNLSVALERINLSAKAYEHAQNIVKQDATLPMAQYNLGWFENQNKNYKEAFNRYEAALKIKGNYTKALRASALNKMEIGVRPADNELAALPPAEKDAYPTIAPKAAVKASLAWWWWVLMVSAILVTIGLSFRAANNSRQNPTLWGLLSAVGIIIAVIVFAIGFRDNSTFSMILWGFVILNILVMIPSSADK